MGGRDVSERLLAAIFLTHASSMRPARCQLTVHDELEPSLLA